MSTTNLIDEVETWIRDVADNVDRMERKYRKVEGGVHFEILDLEYHNLFRLGADMLCEASALAASAEGDACDLRANLDSVQADLDKALARIKDLEKELAEAEAHISSLEEDLERFRR
jgi:ribosome-associated translation inhibitor RaiA